jgi:hypothetical protein
MDTVRPTTPRDEEPFGSITITGHGISLSCRRSRVMALEGKFRFLVPRERCKKMVNGVPKNLKRVSAHLAREGKPLQV